MSIQIGNTINQYQITGRIGEGGMGVVYLAEDTRLQRKVALKFVTNSSANSSGETARFHREARAAARLNHPNICTVYELGEAEDKTFIAMEYVEGITLKERKRQGLFTETEIKDWLKQIAEGLLMAHEAGVVHRDIKPANIMITDKGLIKIMDFGIAKLADSETELTQANSTIGTIAYMSPEQARGETIDQRTDIWSVGVILYELVTGQRPFGGAFREAVMYAMMHEEVRAPSEVNPDISADLERIINTCLQRERVDRFGSLKEVLGVLEGRGPGEIESSQKADMLATDQLLKPSKNNESTLMGSRNRRLLALGGIVLLGLLILLPSLREQLPGLGEGETGLPSALHMAVLPFDTFSDQEADQSFSNGLAHVVATNLLRMEHDKEDLWIIPVREVLSRNVTSAGDARELFGVNLTVSGTILNLTDAVQITLDLTDTRSLRILGSATIEVDELIPELVQTKVMATLGDMLGLRDPESSSMLVAGLTTDPEAYKLYIQGQGFLQKYEEVENIEEAIRLFEEAITIDSTYVQAYAGASIALARLYQFTRNSEAIKRAFQLAEQAIDINDTVAEVWTALSRGHFLVGNYRDAITAGEKAVALDSTSYDTNRMLATAYGWNKEPEKAIPYFEKAIAIQPNYWDVYNVYAIMYGGILEKPEKAVPLFEKVIELAPNNAYGYQNLATMLSTLGQEDKATELYLRANEIEPTSLAYYNLSWSAFGSRAYDEAVEYLSSGIELAPEDESLYLLLGNAYMMLGDLDLAQTNWEKTAQLVEEGLRIPGVEDFYLFAYGAEAHIRLGNLQRALQLIERGASIESLTAMGYFELGLLYEYIQDRDQALIYMERAFEMGNRTDKIDMYPWASELKEDAAFQALLDAYR